VGRSLHVKPGDASGLQREYDNGNLDTKTDRHHRTYGRNLPLIGRMAGSIHAIHHGTDCQGESVSTL